MASCVSCNDGKGKKDVTCCGGTVTETTTKVTKTGGALCEMPTGAVQYIGARYIPVFADPVEWSSDRPYEHLMMVQYEGNTYISKGAVPVGAPIPFPEDENEYWVITWKWSAQIEAYREEVQAFDGRISNVETDTEKLEQEFEFEKEKGILQSFVPTIIGRDFLPFERSSNQTLHLAAVVKHGNVAYGFAPYNEYPNNAQLRYYNVETGAITDIGVAECGHANSAAYISSRNVIAVTWLFEYAPDNTRNTAKKISLFDSNMNFIETVETQHTYYAISYDDVTDTLYGFDIYNPSKQGAVYELDKMTMQEVSVVGTIDLSRLGANVLQDIAVNNGYFYACDTIGTYGFGKLSNASSIEQVVNGTLFDNAMFFNLGEPEGLEFDEHGNLYQAFQANHDGGCIGFTCAINVKRPDYAVIMDSFGTCNCNETHKTNWYRRPYQLASLVEMESLIPNDIGKVEINSNFVDDAYLIHIVKDMTLEIASGATAQLPQLVVRGEFTLQNNGTVDFVKKGYVQSSLKSAIVLNLYRRMFTINNRGTINDNESETVALMSVGTTRTPLVIGSGGSGTGLTIDNVTAVAVPYSMYIGNNYYIPSTPVS